MNYLINKEWDEIIDKKMLKRILKQLDCIYNDSEVFPEKQNLFKAFELVKPNDVKVVIIGQDPYHNVGQANGLAFSLNEGTKVTPSLRNIFLELERDLDIKREKVDLSDISSQGVLLLNSILSVEKGKPLSHKKLGWEMFTDDVIMKLQEDNYPIIFVLWGNYAKSKKPLINKEVNYIVEASHPSPFSARRGFFGSKPFSKINKILKKEHDLEIRW